MTGNQLTALESLIHESDLIPLLRLNRPSLSDEEHKIADGWERCMNFLIDMTQPQSPVQATTHFVPVDKL